MKVYARCDCGYEIEREHVDEGTMVPYSRWPVFHLKPMPEGWTEHGCPKCSEEVRELVRVAALASEVKNGGQ